MKKYVSNRWGTGLRRDPVGVIVELVKGKQELLFLGQLAEGHLALMKQLSMGEGPFFFISVVYGEGISIPVVRKEDTCLLKEFSNSCDPAG